MWKYKHRVLSDGMNTPGDMEGNGSRYNIGFGQKRDNENFNNWLKPILGYNKHCRGSSRQFHCGSDQHSTEQ